MQQRKQKREQRGRVNVVNKERYQVTFEHVTTHFYEQEVLTHSHLLSVIIQLEYILCSYMYVGKFGGKM